MISLSIRRPVAVTMAYGAVTALGLFAWRDLPIELLPDVQLPRLSVTGIWPGASPETVEAFLTSPIEATVQQVNGVATVSSTSSEMQGYGTATVQVEFSRDVDMDFARLDLSERIAALQEELPPGVRQVHVQPYVPEALGDRTRALLTYQLAGPYPLEALRAHIEDVVVPALTQVDGVAVVSVSGGSPRLLEIRLDPEAARSLGLTPQVLQRKIAALDLVRDVGAVREAGHEWTMTIANRPRTADDVLDAIVARVGARPIRVRDVARLGDRYEEAQSYERIDGEPAVTLTVVKQVGGNALEVADRVKAAMARLERAAPSGARYVLLDDESEWIRGQLSGWRARAGGSTLVMWMVLFAFLRSFSAAAVVLSALTFSVLVTLSAIHLGGLTLNLLTLMGLAMGLGPLTDHGIVVLESVDRRWQSGEGPERAAEQGTREVMMPLIASVATNLVVFLPFVYLQGELRLYYVPLGIAAGVAQVASLLVACTLIPALATRLCRGRARRPGGGGSHAAPLYTRAYAALVGWTLRHPWVPVSCAAALFAGSAWLFDRHGARGVGWGGTHADDSIAVQIRLARGADLERTDELVRAFEQKIEAIPAVAGFTSSVRAQDGYIRITFPDSLRETSVPAAVEAELERYGHGFTGVDVRVYGYGPSFHGVDSAPNYTVSVLGYNYEKVREIAEDLGRRLARVPRVDGVDTNASGSGPAGDRATEYVVRIDRSALARWGMSVSELVGRIQSASPGDHASRPLELDGEEVRYQVKLAGSEEADVLALGATIVQLADRRVVRLGAAVTVAPRDLPVSIERENQQYRREVAYEFRGPVKAGDAALSTVLAQIEAPAGYTVRRADGRVVGTEDRAQIHLVLAVALVLIFLVTAAVFESWVQPLCVLLTVPMGLVGTFLLFLGTDAPFTREAYVGAIMTAGIVVNHAILLVDHVNRTRLLATLSFDEAVTLGTLQRVRPILMTSAVTVLGLAPLVLFSDPSASPWSALGFTLIGGLLSSTILVLVVTPALYKLLERGGAKAPRPGTAAQPRVLAPAGQVGAY